MKTKITVLVAAFAVVVWPTPQLRKKPHVWVKTSRRGAPKKRATRMAQFQLTPVAYRKT